ncbi:MAG: ABC transporter substrate-binding protein [Comamonas sp.]
MHSAFSSRARRAAAGLALLLAGLSAQAQDLVLYTSQPNADAQSTVDAFNKVHPDIKVAWVRDGTTQLMTRLEAERQAGAAKPDVLLIADSVTMASLKARGLLQPYLSPNRQGYDAALHDPQGYYYGTKLITTGIAYNTRAAFKPRSWQDLARPELKGQVSMPSPLYSGAALIHLATLTGDAALGWRYYEQLQANGAAAQGGNGAVLTAVASGTKPYGVLVDYMAIREKAKGAPVEFVFPTEGVSLVTEPVAILKSARHVEAARLFVDFLLSRAGQELVVQQGYVPALEGLPMPEGFPPRAQIKRMAFDADQALRDAEADKQRFSALFGAR